MANAPTVPPTNAPMMLLDFCNSSTKVPLSSENNGNAKPDNNPIVKAKKNMIVFLFSILIDCFIAIYY